MSRDLQRDDDVDGIPGELDKQLEHIRRLSDAVERQREELERAIAKARELAQQLARHGRRSPLDQPEG